MSKTAVQTVQVRITDVQMGDVVNKSHENLEGWFAVEVIETLHDGRLVLADETHQNTITGTGLDLVGLQLVRQLNLAG